MSVWGDRRRARNVARLETVDRYADGREAVFGDRLAGEVLVLELACECGRRECEATVFMLRRAYGAVHAAGARVVHAGHEEAAESVVAGGDGFFVVERRFVA